jgi:hypothetical protein
LGEEAFELLKAANSGCGFLTTLHANTAQLGMQSLVTAALMAGDNVPERVVRTTFARLIDLVVHCEAEPLHRVPTGGRRRRQVMEICAVPAQISNDEFVLEPVFQREDFGRLLEFVGHRLPSPRRSTPTIASALVACLRFADGGHADREAVSRGVGDHPVAQGLNRGVHHRCSVVEVCQGGPESRRRVLSGQLLVAFDPGRDLGEEHDPFITAFRVRVGGAEHSAGVVAQVAGAGRVTAAPISLKPASRTKRMVGQ